MAIEERSVTKVDGLGKRLCRERVTVSDLPLSTPLHTSRWQKQFRHTLIEWAASQDDPFGTNSLLTNQIVQQMWGSIYPDVYIGGSENDLEKNLGILITLVSHL